MAAKEKPSCGQCSKSISTVAMRMGQEFKPKDPSEPGWKVATFHCRSCDHMVGVNIYLVPPRKPKQN